MANWVRLWEDMPTDPKWRVIALKADVTISEVIAVFTFMLVNAAHPTHRGRLHNWCDEDVAAALGMDANAIERIRTHANGKVLQGDKLLGWERRQPKREDDSAGRAKEWRENKKQELKENERNRTQSNASERPETETDKEIDKSISKKKAHKKDFEADPALVSILSTSVSEATAIDILELRHKQKKPMTARGARDLVRAFNDYGNPEAAASQMIQRAWTGFKPEWMRQETRAGPPSQKPTSGGAARTLLELKSRIGNANGTRTEAYAPTETLELIPFSGES